MSSGNSEPKNKNNKGNPHPFQFECWAAHVAPEPKPPHRIPIFSQEFMRTPRASVKVVVLVMLGYCFSMPRGRSATRASVLGGCGGDGSARYGSRGLNRFSWALSRRLRCWMGRRNVFSLSLFYLIYLHCYCNRVSFVLSGKGGWPAHSYRKALGAADSKAARLAT